MSATLLKFGLLRTSCKTQRPSPTLFCMPGLTARPNWGGAMGMRAAGHSELADAIEQLEARTGDITDEYDALRAGGASASDYDDANNDAHKLHEGDWSWNSYITKGVRQAAFAVACPRTSDALEGLPRLMLGVPFGFGFFSTLHAGSAIAAHSSTMNLRLRLHLPLCVPAPAPHAAAAAGPAACAMRVAGDEVQWEKGRCVIFDDAYEHEAWNRATGDRALLLVDVWHPDLHDDEIEAIIDMFQGAQQEAAQRS